jgi:histone-lysine N-methyltransferase SETD1
VPAVAKRLEQLPGAAATALAPVASAARPVYQFRYHRPPAKDIARARRRALRFQFHASANKSGCARTEVYDWRARRSSSTVFASIRGVLADDEAGGKKTRRKQLAGGPRDVASESNPGSADIGGPSVGHSSELPLAMQYRQLKEKERLHIEALRSPIHGWGLFAVHLIPPDTMAIEFVGESIRERVADQREREYERTGVGSCYMFRADRDLIIDATRMGGMARFLNHSCDPNCYARSVSIEGIKKIIIYSKRNIEAGEELTYNYNFALEDEAHALACSCGAANCTGLLN